MKGIIAGGSPQTAQAGADILRQGGNAVDAAVAAVFASYLGDIMLATPSGGGFAILHGPGRDPVVYDFFCTTPGLGEDRRGSEIDFAPITVIYESGTSVYHLGRASTAVHGDVAGLAQLLAEAGTMPLEAVLQPTIRLAREGFILNDYQAYLIKLVDVIFNFDPSCLGIFAPHGRWIESGERYANPWLANTLEQIATEGWQSLYTGTLAQAILADQKANGGLITADDLAAYRVIKRDPLRVATNGYTLYTNPPPSAGGILIAYALRLFGHTNRATMTHGDADHIALLAEIQHQIALARRRDRPMELPDPAAWAAWLYDDAADWDAIAAALASGRARPTVNETPGHTSTTHVSAIDETGLAVGITTTPGETAGYVVGDTGLLMNNILGEADLNPGGFFRFAPGVRLASMMAPTIVTDESGPRLVVGSGGSNRLRGAIFQALSNVLDWRLPIAAAVSQPRVHWEDGVLNLEGGYDPAAADALAARGYTVERWPGLNFYFGGTHAVYRAEDAGSGDALRGAGDSRRDGAVVVE